MEIDWVWVGPVLVDRVCLPSADKGMQGERAGSRDEGLFWHESIGDGCNGSRCASARGRM
jgi:hypothetical protein